MEARATGSARTAGLAAERRRGPPADLDPGQARFV